MPAELWRTAGVPGLIIGGRSWQKMQSPIYEVGRLGSRMGMGQRQHHSSIRMVTVVIKMHFH